MSVITIRNIKTILTAPEKVPLVVVKVETSEPGLYGLGCATFTQRYQAVKSAIDNHLKPFVVGKDVTRIEEIWQSSLSNSYWRNGPVMNNALSGIDMALWDIKGKLANMPVYDLFGGKCREGAAVYRHANGRDLMELEESVRAYMESGHRYIRLQTGYSEQSPSLVKPEGALPGNYFDPRAYVRSVPRMFEHIRSRIGFDIELLHDVHERISPIDAVHLAKQLEPYELFFLEDPLAPEQLDWFRMIRQQSSTPIAMGELYVNPREWMPMVAEGLLDFMRAHVSMIGGITPARKLASFCEAYSVRTAWHGPWDCSPVGHAANLHLDLSSPNFGVQEWIGFSEEIQEVFPGCPVVKNGYAYLNDKPGLGIDINEELADKYPCEIDLHEWTWTRTPDGTAVRP